MVEKMPPGADAEGGAEASPASPPASPPSLARGADFDGEQRLENGPQRAAKPHLSSHEGTGFSQAHVSFADQPRSPTSMTAGKLSPEVADRVFPVRSVISVDPMVTPSSRTDRGDAGYFQDAAQARQRAAGHYNQLSNSSPTTTQSDSGVQSTASMHGQSTEKTACQRSDAPSTLDTPQSASSNHSSIDRYSNRAMTDTASVRSRGESSAPSERPGSRQAPSIHSVRSHDESAGIMTARFKHVVSEGGHAVITGRDGDTLQRCEDEPIRIPGAVQGFGFLVALEEQEEGKLVVRVVSENSQRMIGYTPRQLFALESFTDILSEEQADTLLDHVDFIRDDEVDVFTNGPEVFTLYVRTPQRKLQRLWCAMHTNTSHPHLILCEFELEDDLFNPLAPPDEASPETPENTLYGDPTQEEFEDSTQTKSKPLRVLRSARRRKGDAGAMEVFKIMSQVQEQLASAPNLDAFLNILVGVVKELTGFHRVMIYQFDHEWNGRVVTELVDPRATKDLYKGLNFPASDIPKQARDLYKLNKVRMLYDRSQETARLVCRTMEDLETPLDLTHSYLRAMSPIHLKYLANMGVRSSMSISINAFDELWGLIACHGYGAKGMRVSFPIRKMCRLVGESASRNIERLSYASRLQARKLINTVPTTNNPSGYIIASSEDLLKLFDADFGVLSIRDETKILGCPEQSQEALAMLEYLRVRSITTVIASQDIQDDFPDLKYPPGFRGLAGLLLVPLSASGRDFIVFFRQGQLREVKWAGNPYEKFVKAGTEGYLEPRKSFKTWSETVVGKCKEWTEEQIETAAVLCLVYGKFIEVWRQKEAALQNSQLTRLLLANSAHEVRTPLNAIINYLEIALEGSLDQEARDNLSKSHSASKSLIYVINDLLDLTKTEEGGELVKDEIFEIKATLHEATENFKGDAKRKNIKYDVIAAPNLPCNVIGDQRRVRQVISNLVANAVQHTSEGEIVVDMYLVSREGERCVIEVSVQDTGAGMGPKKLDQLFRELEQVQTEDEGGSLELGLLPNDSAPSGPKVDKKEQEARKALGLGLALVARILRNMDGQLRLKSEEGIGSRFVIQLPFDLPHTEHTGGSTDYMGGSQGSTTPQGETHKSLPPTTPPAPGEVTLVDRSTPGHLPRTTSRAREPRALVRETSQDSMHSRRSMDSLRSRGSNLSLGSAKSGRSEADRLIEAIQEPHRVEGWSENGFRRPASGHTHPPTRTIGSHSVRTAPARPTLNKRHTITNTDPCGSPGRIRDGGVGDSTPEVSRISRFSRPGESAVKDSGVPVRPVRVPNEFSLASPTAPAAASANSRATIDTGSPSPESATSVRRMRVLVAEDDPVNSKIIKKRLEKMGHMVHLTVNGEECSSTYCEKSQCFDIVLMDIQVRRPLFIYLSHHS